LRSRNIISKNRPRRSRRFRQLGWLAGVALLPRAVIAQDAQDASADSWVQHLRIGMPVTVNVKAHFSENGQFNLNNLAGATGVSGVNHVFNDGYVKVDNTGDAQNVTGYWGYQNASQYNAAAQTLTFHNTDSYTTSGSADENAQPFIGFDVAYGTDLWRWDTVRLGWEIGAGLTPINVTDDSTLNAMVNQSVYTFNTGAIIVPTAPYNGGPSGVGEPTISDIATAQPGVTVPGIVTGTRRLEMMLYTVRLGPTISWDFLPSARLMVGAGPALGIVNGDYKFDETITTAGGGSALNTGSIGSTKTTFGGYANANLIYHLMEHGDLYIGAQFMPLGDVDVNTPAGRDAKLDLRQALQFSAGINWPF
jgi:hypothetical protein